MERRPYQEFGKRRPVDAPPSGPVKRSNHVALLLMGTFAIGGAAYALMPRENCQPPAPGLAAPAASQADTNCSPPLFVGQRRRTWLLGRIVVVAIELLQQRQLIEPFFVRHFRWWFGWRDPRRLRLVRTRVLGAFFRRRLT